jgi:hypothetical protein
MKNTLLFILATIAFFPLKAQIFAVDPMNLEAEVGQNQTKVVYTVVFNMGPDTLEVLFPAFSGRGMGGPGDDMLKGPLPAGFISSVEPSDFLLPPGTQEHVWITYDSEGFEAGTYHQDLKCVTNDTNIAPVIISNTMHVVNAYTSGFHGYVTDAVTGFAINDCKVKVGEHHVFTNGNGWYELPLEPGVYNVTFVKNGYQTLVVEDTTAVEGFSPLSVELSSFYFIAGRVWADDNFVPDAFSYLYEMNEEGTVLDIFADLTGDLGWFEYPGLSSAYYIIKAEPNPNSSYYGDYLPTYFGDVLYWEDATVVHLTGSTDDAHIHLVGTTTMPSGGGRISGTITTGTDQASMENIPVILQLHGSGDAVMAYSDSDGSFEFSDLGYGNYDLFADVFGKTIVPLNITLDESTPAITGITMVMLSDEIVFLGIEESEFIAGLSKPYPNPAGDQVFLLIDLKKPARLNVEVMDIAGRVIIRDIKNVDGSGVISLDVARIPAGIYTLRIKDDGNGAMTCPFIKE